MGNSRLLIQFCLVALLLALFLWLNTAVQAQTPCPWPSKKTGKRCEKIIFSDKALGAKIDELQNLQEKVGDNGRFAFELGRLLYLQAEKSDAPVYYEAQNLLEKAYEKCPNFNPELLYLLGVIAYNHAQYNKALEYLEAFAKVKKNKLDSNHDQRRADVLRSLDVIRKEQRRAYRQANLNKEFAPNKLAPPSSLQSEYLPALSPDNQWLYFTRNKKVKDLGIAETRTIEEFTRSKRSGDAFTFDMGTVLPDPFNKGGNYGGATLAITNKEMILTVCIPNENGYRNCDLFYTKQEKYLADTANKRYDWRWTELQSLGNEVNTPDGWEAQPTWSPDGTLFFTRYNENTRETDLYFTRRDGLGKWEKPSQMPDSINTDGHDKSPFIHSDGVSLYFASNGRSGEGGFDIFKTVKDSSGWSKPINLGIQVNSDDDEHGLLISTDGSIAMFSANSREEPDNYDLFYMSLPKDVRPEEIVLLSGQIDSAKADTRIEVKDEQGKVLNSTSAYPGDGAYAMVLKKADLKKNLTLSVNQEKAAYEASMLRPEQVKNGVLNAEKMTVASLQKNHPYILRDINFKTNSADVEQPSQLILNDFARYLKANPTLKIEIRGHTDNVGESGANQALSVERALAVKKYLTDQGVPATRLSHRGFGDSMPLDSNDSEQGRARNRRTEFYVL